MCSAAAGGNRAAAGTSSQHKSSGNESQSVGNRLAAVYADLIDADFPAKLTVFLVRVARWAFLLCSRSVDDADPVQFLLRCGQQGFAFGGALSGQHGHVLEISWVHSVTC